MDAAIVLETRIIDTPEAVNTVGFLYAGRYHLGVMLRREVVGDVEHNVSDYATYGREGIWCNVF